jgi:transposase
VRRHGIAISRQVCLIENFFCKLKEFKRIAMRYEKTDQSFAAMIYLAAAVINSSAAAMAARYVEGNR